MSESHELNISHNPSGFEDNLPWLIYQGSCICGWESDQMARESSVKVAYRTHIGATSQKNPTEGLAF